MEQDRFNRKVDPTVNHKAEFRRVEVITGAGRRRQWPEEIKARVVMESFADAMEAGFRRSHQSVVGQIEKGLAERAVMLANVERDRAEIVHILSCCSRSEWGSFNRDDPGASGVERTLYDRQALR